MESGGTGRSMSVPIPDMPWWAGVIWAGLAALSAFFAAQVWPVWRQRLELDGKRQLMEDEEERQFRHAIEERRAKAQELTAQAIEQISKTLTAMDFRLAALERQRGISLPRYGESDRGE